MTHNPGFAGEFWLDSPSAILDYLRLRPAAVKKILCTKVSIRKYDCLPRKYPDWSGELSFTLEGNKEKIKALIQLQTLAEHEFIDAIENSPPQLLVALDEVTDPRNLGAIVRTAGYYGVPYIIVKSKRQVLLTDASVATSQAGFAVTNLVTVVNLSRTLERLKKMDYWALGTNLTGESIDKITGEYEKKVLVLGSEDKGLRKNIQKTCDRLLTIPSNFPGIQSLNVSVAAGIAIEKMVKPVNTQR